MRGGEPPSSPMLAPKPASDLDLWHFIRHRGPPERSAPGPARAAPRLAVRERGQAGALMEDAVFRKITVSKPDTTYSVTGAC